MKGARGKLIYFCSGAVFLLLSGWLFYFFVRGFEPVTGFVHFNTAQTLLPKYLLDSYPSFAHVLAMCLVFYALAGLRYEYRYHILVFWLGVNLAYEFLQRQNGFEFLPIQGRFDYGDVLAILLAGLSFLLIVWVSSAVRDERENKLSVVISRLRLTMISLMMGAGLLSIQASNDGYQPFDDYEVVYMSYEELRGPVKLETGRGLRESGKIYLYNNLLLVSEPNKGIHIYDNTDRSAPVHKVFINLPGNLDMAVRNGYLYADSFIDLVVINIDAIDLNNPGDSITATSRIESTFPYDTYQALDNSPRYFVPVDESKGVVIDIRKRSRVEYYTD